MNQTENYNFNVPVGSDIVNPLVQDFPNWESLDTILRNIANTGITTATHTKTGTIHTLTFSETSVPMIRFQATADFNTNDTFTVNGVSVSALTVAGSALPDGAFVIGSMVLCELRDNLLTVYASGTDADTLEGHPASYFATASNLQTVDDKADANKVLIDQINNKLSVQTLTPAFVSQGYLTVNSSNAVRYGNIIDVQIRFQILQDINVSNASNSILVEEITQIPLPINGANCRSILGTHSADFLVNPATDRIAIYCRQTNGILVSGSFITLNFIYLCE